MDKFYIQANNFLSRQTIGYYHQYYTGYGQPDNPGFLNILKNTFNNTPLNDLRVARDKISQILQSDIPGVMRDNNIHNCVCVCVPRAKGFNTYTPQQLMFKEAISITANAIPGVIDGTDCIRRIYNTRTTHLRNVDVNDGEMPYPGITEATCQFDTGRIRNQQIILIDDIYTKSVNIDEDCIQALLDNGARSVIFYSIGYTRRQ